jgi:hypothetical protein
MKVLHFTPFAYYIVSRSVSTSTPDGDSRATGGMAQGTDTYSS